MHRHSRVKQSISIFSIHFLRCICMSHASLSIWKYFKKYASTWPLLLRTRTLVPKDTVLFQWRFSTIHLLTPLWQRIVSVSKKIKTDTWAKSRLDLFCNNLLWLSLYCIVTQRLMILKRYREPSRVLAQYLVWAPMMDSTRSYEPLCIFAGTKSLSFLRDTICASMNVLYWCWYIVLHVSHSICRKIWRQILIGHLPAHISPRLARFLPQGKSSSTSPNDYLPYASPSNPWNIYPVSSNHI